MEDVFNFDEFLSGGSTKPIIKESVKEEEVPTEVTKFSTPVAEKELPEPKEEKQPEYKETEEVMGTWEKLTKNLQESESFGRAISGSNFLKKEIEPILGKLII